MKKSNRTIYTKEQTFNFLAYPILAFLATGPKSVKEISHGLLKSLTLVKKRMAMLEAQGLVVRQWNDGKWVLRTVLRMERLPEPQASVEDVIAAGRPDGKPVLNPSSRPPRNKDGTLKGPTDLHSIALIRAAAAEQGVETRPAFLAPLPDIDPRPAQAPSVVATDLPQAFRSLSAQAAKVSAHLNVPGRFRGNEVRLGGIERCSCGKGTPLHYGAQAVCPTCARRG